MTIEIAEMIVSYRKNHPSVSWKDTVKELVPEMNCDSVRSYISKFNRGEVRVRQDYTPTIRVGIDYSILTEAWI